MRRDHKTTARSLCRPIEFCQVVPINDVGLFSTPCPAMLGEFGSTFLVGGMLAPCMLDVIY